MKKNEKGATLLEVSLSFVLFAILLESIWAFFSVIHIQSNRLEQQIRMSSEASAVMNFIRQEIRSADKVRIITMVGDKTEVIDLSGLNNIEVRDQPIKSIQYRIKIPETNGVGYTEKVCEMVLYDMPSDAASGAKKLDYIVRSIGGQYVETNHTVVSEMIQNIKVTRYKNSELIEFTCEISKKNEVDPKLIMIKKSTESLQYKAYD